MRAGAVRISAEPFPVFRIFMFFFRASLTKDLMEKLENVGPFECDEVEKHCRVSARCHPIEIPALYTIAKENFNALFLVVLFVSRQSRSQLLETTELVAMVS